MRSDSINLSATQLSEAAAPQSLFLHASTRAGTLSSEAAAASEAAEDVELKRLLREVLGSM